MFALQEQAFGQLKMSVRRGDNAQSVAGGCGLGCGCKRLDAMLFRDPLRRFGLDVMHASQLQVGRLPPHSVEAEQGVLGCALLSPNECLGECIEKLKASSDVFYDLRHRTIYEVLVEMYDHKEAIDLITLQQRLKNRQQLDA